MKLKLLLFALLVPGVLFSQNHQSRLESLDIQHYLFEIELSDNHDKIKGATNITIHFKKDLKQFNLDLVNEKMGKGMKVISVADTEKDLKFTHKNDQLTLYNTIAAGETHVYRIHYEGVPRTGLIISKNKYGDRTFFGDNWPDRARHWLPTADHPSDKATVEWVVTAPEHYKVIGTGTVFRERAAQEGFYMTHWKNNVPIPTKVMVIGVARFAVEKSGEVEGKRISSWVFPQNKKEGFYDYGMAPAITRWFVDKIGSFPFAKLANVQSKTQFGGMENAGNIFYYENSVTGKRTIEGLIAHEIAHQWFGNSASEANWHHIWLSEGFATYFTILYMEDQYGKAKAAELLQKDRKKIIAFNQRNEVPVVNPAIKNYMKLLNVNSYQKGSFVLHMLRNKVGDENFWKAIRHYYDRYKISNALTADLRAVFEEVTGENLETFFLQWIFQAGHPQLEISLTDEKTPTLRLKQTQSGHFTFPLEIQFIYQNGKSHIQTFEVTEKEQLLVSDQEGTLERFIIDPDTKLLFEENL